MLLCFSLLLMACGRQSLAVVAHPVVNAAVPPADVTLTTSYFVGMDYMRFQSDGIDDRLFAVCSYDNQANNIKLFSPQTTELKATGSLTEDFLLQRTIDSPTYTMNTLKIDTTTGFPTYCHLQLGDSEYLYSAGATQVNKIDMSQLTGSTPMQYSSQAADLKRLILHSESDSLIIGRVSVSVFTIDRKSQILLFGRIQHR